METIYTEILRKIAESKGITEEEVHEKMQQAIELGYNNPDPLVQAYWKKIAPDGEMPSPEKLIAIIAAELKK